MLHKLSLDANSIALSYIFSFGERILKTIVLISVLVCLKR